MMHAVHCEDHKSFACIQTVVSHIPIFFRKAISVQHPFLINIYWYVLQVILLYKKKYCKTQQVLSSSLMCYCM